MIVVTASQAEDAQMGRVGTRCHHGRARSVLRAPWPLSFVASGDAHGGAPPVPEAVASCALQPVDERHCVRVSAL